MAAQITPDGAFNTSFGELALTLGPDASPPSPRIRTLRDGYLPVVAYAVERASVRYHVESWALPLDPLDPRAPLLIHVRLTATSLAPAPTTATFTARFADWVSDGSRVEREPDEDWWVHRSLDPPTWAATPATLRRDGDALYRNDHLVLRLPPDGAPTPNGARWSLPLAPGAAATRDFLLPLVPLAATHPDLVAATLATDPDTTLATALAFWRARLTAPPVLALTLPEPKVVHAFRASLAWLLIARDATAGDRVIQTVSENTFKDFFPRDAAFMTRTYDLLNLAPTAAATAERFLIYAADRPARLERLHPDDWGQSLWAIAAHAAMLSDAAFAHWVAPVLPPHLDALDAAMASDPLGLWPAAGPYDNEVLDGHYTGHSLWVLLGLSSAADLFARVGDHDGRARAEALRATYLDRFLAALAPLTAETAGFLPPGLDDPRDGFDWDNLSGGVYPFDVFAPDDPRAAATLALARPFRYREGLVTYGPNAFALAEAAAAGDAQPPGDLHHYLTMTVAQSLLARGDQRAVVEDLYAVLAHTTATHGGFERLILPYGPADPRWNRPPHGWFASRLIELVRNMLVRESGPELHLLSALSPAWVVPGQTVAAERAATRFGLLDLRLDVTADGAVLAWSLAPRERPSAVVVHIPWFVTLDDATVDAGAVEREADRLVIRSPDARTLTLRWRWRADAPDLSYRRAVERLIAKRGSPPPTDGPDLLFGTP